MLLGGHSVTKVGPFDGHLTNNDASLALFRRLGFVEEGRLREHEFFAGAHHDLVLLGRTAAEHWDTHPRPPVR